MQESKQIKQNKPQFPKNLSEINDYLKFYNLTMIIPKEIYHSGNFTKVLKAKLNKKEVILKIYSDKEDNPLNKDYYQEPKILPLLHHQNIINSFHYISDAKIIIQEYAPYGDLNNFRNKYIKKNLTQSILCYFTKHILEGLKYLHSNKIIHLDIKSGNILVNKYLEAMITDFNISIDYSRFPTNEKFCLPCSGTPGYMSPEIIHQKEIFTKDFNKIDIFGLGVLLYYQVYNKFPYNINKDKLYNKKEISTCYKNINQELIFNEGRNERNDEREDERMERHFGKTFQDFLKGMLDLDIEKRFSIEKALNHPWIHEGANIIIDFKEKLGDTNAFILSIMTDSIYDFQNFIKKKDIDLKQIKHSPKPEYTNNPNSNDLNIFNDLKIKEKNKFYDDKEKIYLHKNTDNKMVIDG